MLIARATKQFLVSLRVQNKSPDTRKAYESRLRQLFKILNKKRTSEVKPEDIEYSFITLEERRLSVATRYQTANALRAFARFLKEKGVRFVPDKKIIVPQREEVTVNYPTPEELRKLYDCIGRMDIIGVRDRAILEAYTSSGCRLNELLNVNKDEPNFNELKFQVIGKRRKRRTVYFSPVAAIWIKLYLHMRGEDKEPALFSAHSQNAGRCKTSDRLEMDRCRLGHKSVQGMFRELVKKAGINRKITIHSLRHYFATYCLMAKVDLRTLQKYLGHKKLSTTQIYAHVEDSYAKEEHRRVFCKPQAFLYKANREQNEAQFSVIGQTAFA